jgi:hypothetical protein
MPGVRAYADAPRASLEKRSGNRVQRSRDDSAVSLDL